MHVSLSSAERLLWCETESASFIALVKFTRRKLSLWQILLLQGLWKIFAEEVVVIFFGEQKQMHKLQIQQTF